MYGYTIVNCRCEAHSHLSYQIEAHSCATRVATMWYYCVMVLCCTRVLIFLWFSLKVLGKSLF